LSISSHRTTRPMKITWSEAGSVCSVSHKNQPRTFARSGVCTCDASEYSIPSKCSPLEANCSAYRRPLWCSRCTANAPDSTTPRAVRELAVSDTNSIGGVADTEQTAVAVRPTGLPSSELVIIVTPDARCRITSRNIDGSALPRGGNALVPSGCDMILFSRRGVLLLLALVPFSGAFGKVPHSLFEFLLSRIVLIAQHCQTPRVAGEIPLIQGLASGKRRTGNIPGNAE